MADFNVAVQTTKAPDVTNISQDETNQKQPATNASIKKVYLKSLVIPESHPRKDLGDIASLAASMKREGLIDPLLVYAIDDDQYSIIDGVRRYNAAKSLGLDSVDCIVGKHVEEAEAAHLAYVKNVERNGFNPIEEALHVKQMQEEFGYTLRELEVMGYGSPATISGKLKLLGIDEDVQRQIQEGKLSAEHGKVLSRLSTSSEQQRMAKQCVDHDLSAKKTKIRISQYLAKKSKKKQKKIGKQVPATEIPGVYFKDSRDMCELPSKSAHMVMTSPPYNVGKDFEANVPHDVHLDEVNSVCKEIARVVVPGGIIALNVADITTYKGNNGQNKVSQIELMGHKYQQFFRRHNIILTDLVVWVKPTNWRYNHHVKLNEDTPHTSYRFLHHYDFVYIFRKKGEREIPTEDVILQSKISKEQWKSWVPAVWDIPSVWKQEGHSAQYPEELCHRLIKMFSYEGDTVLDPWLGSGTTIKVARELNRNGIGYEREVKYQPVIMRKLGMDVPEAQGDVQSMAEFGEQALAEVEDGRAKVPEPQPTFITNAPKDVADAQASAA